MAGSAASRAKFLEAGRDLLLNDGDILQRLMTIEQVVDRAGISNTTFYKCYPGGSTGTVGGKAKFYDELLKSLVEDQKRARLGLLYEELRASLVESGGDPRAAIRRLARWDYEQVRSDPAFRTFLLISALGQGHKQAVSAIRVEYAELTDHGKLGYEQILAHWGATLRKPFNTQTLAVLLTAVVEGLALRSLLDPDAVPDELFGDAVVAIAAAVVDIEQTHSHIDDVIGPLADELMREHRLAEQTHSLGNPRQVIIEAAATEFAQRGYFATQLTHVATTAGVDLHTLKQLFPSKSEIVISALRRPYLTVAELIRDDIAIGRSPVDVLTRFMEHFATLIIENRVMSDALLAVVTHDNSHAPETPMRIKEEINFPGIIIPVIEAGQRQGVFLDTESASEVAAILVNSLIIRSFTRRDHSAEEVARAVGTLFLNGLLAQK